MSLRLRGIECSFFGMLYTANGVKPDPEKVRAIQNMEQPKDKKELHTYLGFINYLAPFVPSLASHTALLRELLKANVVVVSPLVNLMQGQVIHLRSLGISLVSLSNIEEDELRYVEKEKFSVVYTHLKQ